jgi:hypothetical protein
MSTLPHSPATHRNRVPIWDTISLYLSNVTSILEIASGTGEHIEYMASRSPQIQWQPSDGNTEMLWAIDTRLEDHSNVLPAQNIDVCRSEWHDLCYDVLLCSNMIHISPWESTLALFGHANPTKYLILYGPFMENGKHNSEGNARFDASLRAQDPSWGIRDLTDLRTLGKKYGFTLHKKYTMPANNQTLIWVREE